ncbi:MAG TPA: hypothetical protein VJ717_09845 [Gemmatimonadaceae bacterium]|nr:hypothetical protein [Gemmatimonadaceae bacterium]
MRRLVVATLTLTTLGCAADRPTAATYDAIGHAHISASRGIGDLGPDVLSGLAEIRHITAKFHSLDAAAAAGYSVWSPDPFAAGATCPTSADGNMGYHRVNLALRGGAANPAAGDATIDPLQPEMLLYEKRPDGEVHLVGVEYLVFTAAWERVHGAGAAPPEVLGEPLLASLHTFPGNANPIPHYELHVWIWTTNPNGMFSPWNPTVTC